jgi:hypothetical protein
MPAQCIYVFNWLSGCYYYKTKDLSSIFVAQERVPQGCWHCWAENQTLNRSRHAS